jgi:hypothetical protein
MASGIISCSIDIKSPDTCICTSTEADRLHLPDEIQTLLFRNSRDCCIQPQANITLHTGRKYEFLVTRVYHLSSHKRHRGTGVCQANTKGGAWL